MKVAGKHRATLEAVFSTPVRASIAWRDIEALFVACGAEISEGQGSRVRAALNGVRAVFHRPHPQKELGAALSDRSGDNAMTMMSYKAYEAVVEYDEDSEIFHGEVINLRDVITFQGKSVSELKRLRRFRRRLSRILQAARRRTGKAVFRSVRGPRRAGVA
jgi:hypothetical protein